MVLDLSLNAIKIPNMPTYNPGFGTKQTVEKKGNSTLENMDNILLPFQRQRPYAISENSSTGIIEADASKTILSGCSAITLGNGSFVGVKVFLINKTALYVLVITGTQTGYLLPYDTIEVLWDGSDWVVNDGVKTGEVITYSGMIDSIHPVPYGYLSHAGWELSRTAYARLWTRYSFDSVTVTCTTATPAVFTKSSHGFLGGERLRLFTTGSLTGATLSQDYFVEYINADTFYLNTTENGTDRLAITAQSGTHTYQRSLYGLGDGSTTFRTPDYRQCALVASGSGSTHAVAAEDAYREGQFKDDQAQAFTVKVGMWSFGGGGGYGYFVNSTAPNGYINCPVSDVRSGTTTRGKRVGVNYLVKF